MTIAFFNTLYYPQQVGGAEISVQLLCEALVKRGHKVYVISLSKENKVRRINGVIAITLKIKNLYAITEKEHQPAWKKMIWHLVDANNFFYKKVLTDLINRIRPDVVNTNNLQGFSAYTWRVLQKKGIPVIHTFRDYYLLCYRTTCFKNHKNCERLCTSCNMLFHLKKPFFSIPSAYIGISQFILDQHQKYVHLNNVVTTVIANSVKAHAVSRPRLPTDNEQLVIGFIGRITEEKGIELLFRELSLLPTDKKYQVLLAGTYEEAYKEKLIAKYRLNESVVFKGKMNPADFFQFVDLVVVPSIWNEPFGRVPIEAASYSKPVCIIDKGGLSELYEPACMWQFSEAEGSLAGILTCILNDPGAIGKKALHCRHYVSRYDQERLVTKFENLIDKIKD